MKTIKFIPKKKYILAFMISGLFYFSSYAQDISDRLHFNVDWQMNAPLNTNFADKISGWGMNLEGGYFLTPHKSRLSSYHSGLPLHTDLSAMDA